MDVEERVLRIAQDSLTNLVQNEFPFHLMIARKL